MRPAPGGIRGTRLHHRRAPEVGRPHTLATRDGSSAFTTASRAAESRMECANERLGSRWLWATVTGFRHHTGDGTAGAAGRSKRHVDAGYTYDKSMPGAIDGLRAGTASLCTGAATADRPLPIIEILPPEGRPPVRYRASVRIGPVWPAARTLRAGGGSSRRLARATSARLHRGWAPWRATIPVSGAMRGLRSPEELAQWWRDRAGPSASRRSAGLNGQRSNGPAASGRQGTPPSGVQQGQARSGTSRMSLRRGIQKLAIGVRVIRDGIAVSGGRELLRHQDPAPPRRSRPEA